MPSSESPQARALVIDDDETVVEQVTQMLHTMGFAVEHAIDGLDALRRCQAGRFDVLICDMRMPRLSGLSFLSNLGGTQNASTKVVMISALDDNAIRDQALASGAAAYLVKPIAAWNLRNAIALDKKNP
jgi:two-component system, OmpR family, response regulator ResD